MHMGTCDLPEIYTLTVGPSGPCAHVYISDKSLFPLFQ